MTGWRFRRCPACGKVAKASEYTLVGPYGAYWDADGDRAERECPSCGHTGTTNEFPVVREVHPEGSTRSEWVRERYAASFTSKATVKTTRNIWDRIAGFCARCKQPLYHEEATLVAGARVHIGPCP